MGYDLRHFREVIEQVGAHPAAIAKAIGCSRGTVYAYLQKYPELKAAFEQKRGAGVADRAQYPRDVFEKAIQQSYGIKSAVAEMVGCSRQTVDNALERWPELAVMLDYERHNIVDAAESKLIYALNAGDMRAILFTLETLGKSRGWTRRTELTGADGAALISPEIAQLIHAMGMDVSEVARQFEVMVRMAAAEKGVQG